MIQSNLKCLFVFIATLCLMAALQSQAVSLGSQRVLKPSSIGTHSQKRVALVIGNAAYQGSSKLRNPVNDAKAISKALNEVGFEVIEVTDATQKEMNRAITTFGSKLNAETAALFFYAGHGLQVKGRNYIVPIDAQIETEAAVASESVSIDTVLEQLNVSTMSIVILDACRNNPFERSFRKLGGGGLAQMDAPKGSFIAYATAPGKTAADGEGKNGLFTQELLKQIQEPGLPLESVFKRVRASVSAKSGDAQMPWDSSSMTGEFYFRPASNSRMGNVVPNTQLGDDVESILWQAAENSGVEEDVRSYLRQYPKGKYIAEANARLKRFADEKIQAHFQVEQDAWLNAGNGNTEESYQEYLKAYPSGRYVVLASGRLRKLQEGAAAQEYQFWQATDKENSLAVQRYLERFPNGKYSALARTTLESSKATIYFLRKGGFLPSGHTITAQDSDTEIGELDDGTYLIYKCSPGERTIKAVSPIGGHATLTVEIKPKETYYFLIDEVWGPKTTMEFLSSAAGTKIVTNLKLVDSNAVRDEIPKK
jgi:uncharacterized caspase-like protein